MASLIKIYNMIDKPKFDFAVGGQALIEGVMMRSANFVAIAVRKQDGSIKIHDWPFKSVIQRWRFLNIPIVRGVVNMVEMLILGMKSINLSAEEAVETEEEIIQKRKIDEEIDSHKTDLGKEIWGMVLFVVNIIVALGFALVLFKLVPIYTTEFLRNYIPLLQQSDILYNLVDGGIKIAIFVLYIAGISMIPSIGRVFEYHGAEHKSVFAYENNEDLTTVNGARKQSRFHPRCGTSFIFMVILISIVVYTFIPRNPEFWIQFGQRIFVLPLIAGIAYEALKLSAKHRNNFFVRMFVVPGLWFQRLTTSEPNDQQLEVALEALNRTLELEKDASKN